MPASRGFEESRSKVCALKKSLKRTSMSNTSISKAERSRRKQGGEKTMLMKLLFLSFVFMAGLISTIFGFQKKKVFAWLMQSLSAKAPPHETSKAEADNNKVKCNHNKVELKSIFATFDKNNDGFITKQELRDSLNSIGIFVTEDDVADMVAKVDYNGDGQIEFDEFCEFYGSMMMKKETANDDEEEEKERDVIMKEAFDIFDGDGDGLITEEELALVLDSLGLKEGRASGSCKEMIRKVDMDGDGMVDFNEFKRMMKADGRLVLVP